MDTLVISYSCRLGSGEEVFPQSQVVISRCVLSCPTTEIHDSMLLLVAVRKVLSLCDSLSATDDIRNGVLCSLLPDFVSMLKTVTGPFAQRESTSHITVCIRLFCTVIAVWQITLPENTAGWRPYCSWLGHRSVCRAADCGVQIHSFGQRAAADCAAPLTTSAGHWSVCDFEL